MTNRILRITLTVLIAAGACLAARSYYVLLLAKVSYSFCSTLLSVTVLHLRIRHSRKECGLFAAVALVLLGLAATAEHPLSMRSGLAVLGIASLAILAVHVLWSAPSQRIVPLWAFVGAVSLVGSGWIIPPFLDWAGQGSPKVLDLYLASFDASLGFQPSFALGTLLFKFPALNQLAGVFYMGVALIVTLVFGDRLLQDVRKALLAFVALVLVGPVGSLFYALFPAVGPVYVFPGNFPTRPLPASVLRHIHLEPVALGGYRNAIPSLHMAWAILGLWYSRGMAWWIRAIAWTFFVFTVLATLGMGEHYLIDLIVAFPFSLMIFGVFYSLTPWRNAWQIRAAVFGFGATILWMILLRFEPGLFWVLPVIPWALMALTVGATLALKRRLEMSANPIRNGLPAANVADVPARV